MHKDPTLLHQLQEGNVAVLSLFQQLQTGGVISPQAAGNEMWVLWLFFHPIRANSYWWVYYKHVCPNT